MQRLKNMIVFVVPPVCASKAVWMDILGTNFARQIIRPCNFLAHQNSISHVLETD